MPDRLTLLGRWTSTIRTLARIAPVVIALDDLHRADLDTLTLAAWLAEELLDEPILLLIAHRPTPEPGPKTDSLSNIAQAPHAEAIDLGPLKRNEIHAMIDSREGDTEAIASALLSRTDGNPFFIKCLLRSLCMIGKSENLEEGLEALPSNGSELVARQLIDLPTETRDALEAAAISGARFSASATARLIGISDQRLLEYLEPALRTSLIKPDSGHGKDYRFTHTILRDALYQSIRTNSRHKLHLKFAKQLLSANGPAERCTEAADHLYRALPLAPIRLTRTVSATASSNASTRCAFAEAQVFAERALSLVYKDPDASEAERCQALLTLGKTQLYNGEEEQARKTLLEAAVAARRAKAPDLLARCALQLVPDFLSIEVGTYDSTLIQLLQEAIDTLPDSSVTTRANLLARLSQARHWGDDWEANEATATEALELARSSNAPEALMAALSARAESLHGPARAQDRIEVLNQLGFAARKAGDIPTLLAQQTRLVAALLELGDICSVDSENDTSLECAENAKLPQFRWYPNSIRNMRRLMRGDFGTYEPLESLFFQTQRMSGNANIAQGHACQQIYRQIELDDSNSVLPIVSAFTLDRPRVRSWRAAFAWLQWDAGHTREAERALFRFHDRDIVALSREAGGGIGLAALAELSAALESRPHCERLYALISTVTERCATAGYGVVYFGSFARYAGLLAGALGDTATAVRHLSDAVSHEIQHGAPIFQSYAEIDLAIALFRDGATSEGISQVLDETRTTASASSSLRVRRKLAHAIRLVGK
jgi:hypothetical protein